MPTKPEENPNRLKKKKYSYKFLSTAVLIGSLVKQSSKNCPHYIICFKRKYWEFLTHYFRVMLKQSTRHNERLLEELLLEQEYKEREKSDETFE